MRAMTAFTNEFAYDYWIGTRWPGVGSAGGGGLVSRKGMYLILDFSTGGFGGWGSPYKP